VTEILTRLPWLKPRSDTGSDKIATAEALKWQPSVIARNEAISNV